jgi:hypothetical protein
VVLKSYAHVPVSDLELCFPDTTVALPMFDIVMTVVLCLVALLSLLPTLLSGGMTSTMLPLIVMVLGRVVTKVTVLLNLKTTLGFKKSLALYNKSRDSQVCAPAYAACTHPVHTGPQRSRRLHAHGQLSRGTMKAEPCSPSRPPQTPRLALSAPSRFCSDR